MVLPRDASMYGYLSEYNAYGETPDKTEDYAEDMATSMLSSTQHTIQRGRCMRHEADLEHIWKNVTTRNICQSAEANKDGLWTTAIAAAIML